MKGKLLLIFAFALTFLGPATGSAGPDLLAPIQVPDIDQLKALLVESGELGNQAVLNLDLVIDLMSNDHSRIRQAAAVVLGEVKDPVATDILTDALFDPEPAVVLAAVEAMGKIRDGRAVEPLIVALENNQPDSEVQSAIICSLAEIGDQNALSGLRQLAEAGHKLSQHCWTEQAEHLLKGLSS